MADPQQEFRAELESLRRTVIESIQQGISSNVAEGLSIYQRLLSTTLNRFNSLYGDNSPRYSRDPLFSDPSGQQMQWIRNDYEDFLQQALNTRSPLVLFTVVRGISEAANACIVAGDVGALSLFEGLQVHSWIYADREVFMRGYPEKLREELLSGVSFQIDVAVSSQRHRKDRGGKTRTILAQIVKTFSELMKASVDSESAIDLSAVAERLVSRFVSQLDFYRDAADPFGLSGETLIYIRDLTTAALVGIDGWILHQAQGDEGRASSLRLHNALKPWIAHVNPWDALPLVIRGDPDDFFGWTSWEIFSKTQRPNGFIVSITGDIRASIILAAISSGILPTDDQLRFSGPGFSELKELEIGQLLNEVGQLAEKWSWIEQNSTNTSALRSRLDAELKRIRAEYSSRLIGRELSSERLEVFRETIRISRTRTNLTEVFSPTKADNAAVADETSDEINYLTFGLDQFVPKDFFVYSDVEANPSGLASQIVRGQRNAEQSFLFSSLRALLPSELSSRALIVDQVDAEIDRLRKLDSEPVIIVSGSYTLAGLFEGDDAWTETPPQFLRQGTFKKARIFWTISVRDQMCIVVDPRLAGKFDWREQVPEPGDVLEEEGRLLVAVRVVDQEKAEEFVRSNPSLQLREGVELSQTEAIRRLQEDVHVKVVEQLAWNAGSPAGMVFELPDSEDFD